MKTSTYLFLIFSSVIISCNKSETFSNDKIYNEIENNGKIYITNQASKYSDIEKMKNLTLIKIDTITQKKLAKNYLSYLNKTFFKLISESENNPEKFDSALVVDKKIKNLSNSINKFDSVKFRNYRAKYYTEVILKNRVIKKDTISLIFDKSGFVADENQIIAESEKEFK